MMTRTVWCQGPSHKRAAFQQAWTAADLYEGAFEIVVREAKSQKSREQEEKYHAIIGEIASNRTGLAARSGVVGGGRD